MQTEQTRATETVDKPVIDVDDPEACKACHAGVYEEWTESMHSRAHHDNDPIYGNMRALRMKKQGEQVANQCVKCHNPRSPSAPDEPAGKVGISCAACHQVKAVHLEQGKVGVETLVYDTDGVMHSGRELPRDASPVHALGAPLAAMQDGQTLCLSCHNATKTPTGAPACTTGPEFKSSALSKGDEGQTCVSCHMPEVEGAAGAVGRQEKHRSHKFLGPHRAWYQDDKSILTQAVDMDAEIKGNTLHVSLKNKSVHAFPSGFPGRMVVVKVVGLDEHNNVAWENFTENAMKESPESVLNKVYHDKEGKPVAAPFAEKMVRDNRLKADESRSLEYVVPDNVKAFKIKMLYFLLPPPLSNTLGIEALPEAKPVVFMSKDVMR